jgi:hypothetical protein
VAQTGPIDRQQGRQFPSGRESVLQRRAFGELSVVKSGAARRRSHHGVHSAFARFGWLVVIARAIFAKVTRNAALLKSVNFQPQ